jgi:hypothetical protein
MAKLEKDDGLSVAITAQHEMAVPAAHGSSKPQATDLAVLANGAEMS